MTSSSPQTHPQSSASGAPPPLQASSDTRAAARRLHGTHRFRLFGSVGRFVLSLLVAGFITLLATRNAELGAAPVRMLFILTLAAGLWISEAIPAFAVGILVIALQILLLGNPEAGVFAKTGNDWENFVGVLGNPLVWLFFGGFVLGAAIAKTGLDRSLADRLLGWSGTRPPNVLLGTMAGTLLFSMFMSNTATTAMMLAVMSPVIARVGRANPFSKALLLGIPFSANLGGMGTLIGSPPNAIAAGALATVPDQAVGFLSWMLVGVPPAITLFVVTWFYLKTRYPSTTEHISPPPPVADDAVNVPGWQRWLTTATLLITVALWMSGQWTRLPTAAVSFLPITLLTATGILTAVDVRKLPWDILLMLAGGLALGNGVRDTGLADWLVSTLPLDQVGMYTTLIVLCYATVMMSNLMSNTAAANILMPIAVAMATAFEATAAVTLALCASCAMCLPISTPPNAIAFSSGQLHARDFLEGGIIIGLLAPLVTISWAWFLLT